MRRGIAMTCTVNNCRRNNITTGGHDSELYIDKVSLDSFISLIEQERKLEF